jgi:hypothetical protein
VLKVKNGVTIGLLITHSPAVSRQPQILV